MDANLVVDAEEHLVEDFTAHVRADMVIAEIEMDVNWDVLAIQDHSNNRVLDQEMKRTRNSLDSKEYKESIYSHSG